MISKFMLIPLLLIAAVSIHPVYGLAPFVDETKNSQSYVDRYHNEPSYKEWFDSNYPGYDSIYEAVGLQEPIPVWIKSSALLYGQGEITDNEFFNIIQFLIDGDIITVPNTGDSSDRVSALELELSESKANTQSAYDKGYKAGYDDGLDKNEIVERVSEPEVEEESESTTEPESEVRLYDTLRITKTGQVDMNGKVKNYNPSIPLTITATGPNGDIVSSKEIYPNSSGAFWENLPIDDSWKTGDYTFVVEHGSVSDEATFNYTPQPESTISIKTDSDSYSKGQEVIVTGKVSNLYYDIPMIINMTNPNGYGNLLDYQADLYSDGSFRKTLDTGYPWIEIGDYTVVAKYGSYSSDEITVSVIEN